jgi:hypothetical protein
LRATRAGKSRPDAFSLRPSAGTPAGHRWLSALDRFAERLSANVAGHCAKLAPRPIEQHESAERERSRSDSRQLGLVASERFLEILSRGLVNSANLVAVSSLSQAARPVAIRVQQVRTEV